MAKKSKSGFFGFSVTEVIFQDDDGQRKKFIRLNLGDREVRIYVDDITYANFQSEFVRGNPSQKQKTRHATMMKAMLAAYLAGLHEGQGTK